ncbi:MAG: VWA domain-containing protein [Oscillospiraceae bacterium]|nr:VWA domain-containing protein [Oscillospiraceae bacterium]
MFKKVISMVLALTMVCSVFLFVLESPDEASAIGFTTLQTGGLPIREGINIRSKVSDVDTSNIIFINPPQISVGGGNVFLNSTANDGRIWTDKSVNANKAFIYDGLGGTVDSIIAQPDELLVTLSALSQTINIRDIIVEPSDTVFVIDVSGSMHVNSVPGDGRSRIEVLIDALNDAIQMLMDADPNNRVALVVYGGRAVGGQNHARFENVLALGRYNSGAGGRFFTANMSPSIPVVNVNATAQTGTAAPIVSSFTVDGGTPTQLGIRLGAQVLLNVPQGQVAGGTMINLGTSAVPNWVTRKPNIVLMTDGEPTYAWLDYRLDGKVGFTGTTYDYTVGNGSTGDLGLTALTIMTASYVRQLVRDHYYDPSDPTLASRTIGFYTIGLGVNSVIANAMLNPYGPSASGLPNAQLVTQTSGGQTYNMLTILNDFTDGSGANRTISMPVIAKGASSSNPSRPVQNIVNNNNFVQTCNYSTLSFTAMNSDDLRDAFGQITQQIVSQGNYSTLTGDAEEFSGYVTFSDVLGEYMEFRNFYGVWHNNRKFDGSTFARAVVNNSIVAPSTAEAVLFNILHAHTGINQAQFNALIAGNRASGALSFTSATNFSNRISYFADADGVFLASAYDAGGAPAAPPSGAVIRVDLYGVQGEVLDTIEQNFRDLMYIPFQVITALTDGPIQNMVTGSYPVISHLLTGDQVIRWYIPAALTPARAVEPVFQADGTPELDPTGRPRINVKKVPPIRVVYSVGPNYDRLNYGVNQAYANAFRAPGENSFFFYANRWRGANGAAVGANVYGNLSQAFFQPGVLNRYYAGVIDRTQLLKTPNITGPTGTSPWAWAFLSADSGATEIQRLGNNGRMTLQIQTRMTITKAFNFTPPPGIPIPDDFMFSVLIFGSVPNPSGGDPIVVYRRTLLYPRDFTGNTAEIYLPVLGPGSSYTISKEGGFLANYSYTRYGLAVAGPFTADHTMVVNLTNNYLHTPNLTPQIRLRKMFHGLYPDERPNTFSITLGLPDGTPRNLNFTELTSTAGVVISGGDLQYGMYTITEFNYDVDGFYHVPGIRTFTITAADFALLATDSQEILITIHNIYTPIPPPNYTLDLNKVVQGLAGNSELTGNPNVPQGLLFKLEREADALPGFVHFITYEEILASDAGLPLENLPAGNYTITELGGEADGFTGPAVTVTVTQNGVAQTPTPNTGTGALDNSFRFTLGGDNDVNIAFTFTNAYTPIQPLPPPVRPLPDWPGFPDGIPVEAPQTGVERNMILPLAIFALGAILIGGTALIFIRRRKSK